MTETCLVENWLITSRCGVNYACEMETIICSGELPSGLKGSLQYGENRCAEEKVT